MSSYIVVFDLALPVIRVEEKAPLLQSLAEGQERRSLLDLIRERIDPIFALQLQGRVAF